MVLWENSESSLSWNIIINRAICARGRKLEKLLRFCYKHTEMMMIPALLCWMIVFPVWRNIYRLHNQFLKTEACLYPCVAGTSGPLISSPFPLKSISIWNTAWICSSDSMSGYRRIYRYKYTTHAAVMLRNHQLYTKNHVHRCRWVCFFIRFVEMCLCISVSAMDALQWMGAVRMRVW